MKSLIGLGLIFLFSSWANAGDKVGNGGGLWTCVMPDQSLSQALLVDLYEAREEFGLTLLSTPEPVVLNIVQERQNFLQSNWPQAYQDWSPPLSGVLMQMRFVNSELLPVDDALFRVKPLASRCAGQWKYAQLANFTYQGQVLINNELWQTPNLATLDKAALIWHETIYKYLRDKYGDTDSVRARQIVGLLFSNLDITAMRPAIEKVLATAQGPNPPPQPPTTPPAPPKPAWVCQVKNNVTGNWYLGYAASNFLAKAQATESCQKSAVNAVHCDNYSALCEQIQPNSAGFTCQYEDLLHQLQVMGSGSTQLEANYDAHAKCMAGTPEIHCQPVTCIAN